jgi:hypothetical protein
MQSFNYDFDQTLAPDEIGTLWDLISCGANGSATLVSIELIAWQLSGRH